MSSPECLVLGEGWLRGIIKFRGYLAGVRALSKCFIISGVSSGCRMYSILASPFGYEEPDLVALAELVG
jgi:hypothetical protein